MKIRKIILLMFIFLGLFANKTQAQDWANLARYEAENATLKAPTNTEQRIVFMGNSITEGWGTDSTSFMGENGYINRGISGQTTPQMLIRFRPDVVHLQPKVVVILAGINDIAQNTGPITIENIADNIFSMIEIAQANDIKVILCSVLPANHFPWREAIKPAEKVIQLNALLQAYAAENKIHYVDYFSAMADAENGLPKTLGYDGVHPNAAGYAVMEKLMRAAIDKTLD